MEVHKNTGIQQFPEMPGKKQDHWLNHQDQVFIASTRRIKAHGNVAFKCKKNASLQKLWSQNDKWKRSVFTVKLLIHNYMHDNTCMTSSLVLFSKEQ